MLAIWTFYQINCIHTVKQMLFVEHLINVTKDETLSLHSIA